MEIGFLFTSGLLLLGLLLRVKIRLLQVLYIPAAISGGLIGLALLQAGVASADYGHARLAETAEQLIAELHTWPGWLLQWSLPGCFWTNRDGRWGSFSTVPLGKRIWSGSSVWARWRSVRWRPR